MRESIYNIKLKYNDKGYIYNSRNNGIIEFCDEDLNDEENVKYLLEEKYYVEDDYDEVESVVEDVNKAIKEEDGELTLTILLTKQCNFRCVYCYQEREALVLTIENAKKITATIEEMFQLKKYKKLLIHFFGGEPLLNMEVLSFLDSEFKKLTNSYNVEYWTCLTTNGSLLTRDIFRSIKIDKIQLTFDGLESNHNNIRKSSMFSYKDTLKLIPVILEFCDAVNLRFNVCEENKNDLLPFIDYIMSNFEKDNINFHVARTIKFNEKDQFTMIDFNEYCELELQARLKLQDYGKKLFLPTRRSYNCSFINKNALSISPDLRLYECDGDNKKMTEMFSKKSMEEKRLYKVDESCRQCNILPLCLGGCPKTRGLGYESCIVEKNIVNELLINHIKQEEDVV